MNKFITGLNIIYQNFYPQLLKGKLPYYWLALIITLFYYTTLGFGFSPLDDPILIVDKIDWLKNPVNIFLIFTNEYQINLYRPVLILSFFIDTIFGKGYPIIFHLSNILFHITASFLLYYLLTLISNKKYTAFILSALFAIHPVNIHAVAWIPGRNDVILTLMSISTIITFIRFKSTDLRSLLAYHALFFTLAIFTKETAIILPLLTVLINRWVFHDKIGKLKIILTLQSIIVAIWIISKIYISPIKINIQFGSIIVTIENLFIYFISSIGKSIFPLQQAITPFFQNIPLLYFIISVLFIIWILLKKDQINGWGVVGILWFILFLIPAGFWSLFVTRDNILYEHRLYLPLVGLAILFQSLTIRTKCEKKILIVLFFIFVALSIYQNRTRIDYYSDESKFAAQCLSETPNCVKSFLIHGELAFRNLDYNSAVKDFYSAIRLKPDNHLIYNRIGYIYESMGLLDSAITYYRRASVTDSNYAEGYYNIGNIYLNLKDYSSAVYFYSYAIESDSTFIPSYYNRSISYFQLGKILAAMKDITFVDNHGYPVNPEFLKSIKIELKKNQ